VQLQEVNVIETAAGEASWFFKGPNASTYSTGTVSAFLLDLLVLGSYAITLNHNGVQHKNEQG